MCSSWSRYTLAVVLLASGLGLSCGDSSSPPEPALTVKDSAGIEVVAFDLDQVGEYGTSRPTADWVFGGSPSRPTGVSLYQVTEAMLMSDGRLAVVNWSTQELFLVDPDGSQAERLTGRGDGPGELRFVESISEQDGTIGVYDARHREWMTYRNGEFLEAENLPRIGTPGLYFPEVVIQDGKGLIIGDAYIPPGAPRGVPVRRMVLVARVEKGAVDTIAVVPGDVGLDKITGISPQLFGPSYAIVKADSGLWLGNSSRGRLEYWSRAGRLRRVVRWRSSADRELTRKRINAFRDSLIAERPPEFRARLRQSFKEAEFPSEVPAWGRVIRGSDGLLWISEYPGPRMRLGVVAPPYPALEWWAVDPEGRPVGTLTSPAGLQVTAFERDFLIGIYKDSLNVETIRKYRIDKTRDGG